MKKTRRWIGVVVALAIGGTAAVWIYFMWARDKTIVQPALGTLAAKSEDAILGAIGFRRETVDEKHLPFFERMIDPAWKSLEVRNAGSVTRTDSDIRQLEKLGFSSGSRKWLETTATHDRSSGYRLVTLQIRDSEGIARELLELSESNAYIRSILRRKGVRIVREVDQVFDDKTTEKLKATTGSSATLEQVRGTDVQLAFGAERTTTVEISNGSVVSYRLALLCWSKDGTLHPQLDQGDACPAGFSETLPDVVRAPAVATAPKPCPKSDIPPQPGCPSIEGWWIREADGVRLKFQQNGCTIAANAPEGAIAHTFNGQYVDNHYQYVVRRTNKADNCMTEMYGSMTLLPDDRLRVVVAATDGKCDLPASFWEDLVWRRAPAVAADVNAPSTAPE